MPFASAPDGARIYYETNGRGEPLLLVMGRGSNHFGWGPIASDFAARWQVIVYDQRGTGQSDKPHSPPYSLHGFAQDALAVLDDLGRPRAHVYGVSMGGRIAQWLGIDAPARVGARVLGWTTPGDAHGVARSAAATAAMASGQGAQPLMFSFLWMVTHLPLLASLGKNTPPPAYAVEMHARASEAHDAWDRLPEIKAPTLVVHGERDLVAPVANAHLLAERIPGAELHIVPRGRHMFYLEFRREVNRVVMDFLARYPLNKMSIN